MIRGACGESPCALVRRYWPISATGKEGLTLTPNKEKALVALLTQPTKAAAAAAAGIAERTLRSYLSDSEFQERYKQAFGELVTDATRQAQQSLSPALSTLREIVEDNEQGATVRIQAARSLLEYGLRLTEITDILRDLEAAEGK